MSMILTEQAAADGVPCGAGRYITHADPASVFHVPCPAPGVFELYGLEPGHPNFWMCETHMPALMNILARAYGL